MIDGQVAADWYIIASLAALFVRGVLVLESGVFQLFIRSLKDRGLLCARYVLVPGCSYRVPGSSRNSEVLFTVRCYSEPGHVGETVLSHLTHDMP
jgi:hypothetical protein